MLTFAEFAVGVAEWLAPPTQGELPTTGSRRRVVISFEKDGSLRLEAWGWEETSLPEPTDLRAAAVTWTCLESGASRILRVVVDPLRVAGRPDEPGTLFALHALAARRTDARVILKLPSDQFGRRW